MPGRRHRQRILIVDDDAVMRKTMKRLLSHGVRDLVVAEAATRAEALQRVAAEPWDTALVDLHLGAASGLDLVRDIKKLRPEVAVIVVSGAEGEAYATAALRLGAAGFVTKLRAISLLLPVLRDADLRRRP